MTNQIKKNKTALISVYNKEGIVDFAKELGLLGFNILASGGTASVLSSAGIKVTDVATIVGEPILGHRVVTLSREIHAGLLARDTEEDRLELDRLNIPWIDLVCVDLYPLSEAIERAKREGLSAKSAQTEIIEKTDIGGPTMLRSAAKGRRIVICDPSDRPKVIEWLKNGESNREEFISMLAAKAESLVAIYCLISARFHSQEKIDGFVGELKHQNKYGENGWQVPAGLYANLQTTSPSPSSARRGITSSSNLSLNPSPQEGRENCIDELALSNFKLVAGQEPGYNNWADVDRMLQTITHIAAGFEQNNLSLTLPSRGEGKLHIAVGVKHGNPCGAAVDPDPKTAIQKMLEGDLRAIFGGLIMVNYKINEELAEVLLNYKMENGRRLLDCIVAPEFTQEAIDLLKRKGDKCRFLVNPALALLDRHSLDQHTRFRYVRGGFLKQPNYNFILDLNNQIFNNQTENQTAKNWANYINTELSNLQKFDIILAWAVGSTSNSNTITITKNGMLLGNGVGQQDRVGGCELAIKRARNSGHNLQDAVAYSDSFFPFVDGVSVLVEAGIKTIFATSGSVRDEEIKKYCSENNINLIMQPDSLARGFFGH